MFTYSEGGRQWQWYRHCLVCKHCGFTFKKAGNTESVTCYKFKIYIKGSSNI
uniref:Uncharacterized protein n=1 Tax=Chlamydomonas reinhardtii TaxID=3055 RepID=V9GZX6_CHLRE|nr:hypothetical protein 2 - Chlamydomonas reinhardtii chloroplast [Chlamydomonas reinhardtii]AAA84145.1 unknown protein [Chlamydomonas reinhardtii]